MTTPKIVKEMTRDPWSKVTEKHYDKLHIGNIAEKVTISIQSHQKYNKQYQLLALSILTEE